MKILDLSMKDYFKFSMNFQENNLQTGTSIINLIFYLNKNFNLYRMPIYNHCKSIITDLALEVPTLSQNVRKELDFWEYQFIDILALP